MHENGTYKRIKSFAYGSLGRPAAVRRGVLYAWRHAPIFG